VGVLWRGELCIDGALQLRNAIITVGTVTHATVEIACMRQKPFQVSPLQGLVVRPMPPLGACSLATPSAGVRFSLFECVSTPKCPGSRVAESLNGQ
jgi:hypothetical protein